MTAFYDQSVYTEYKAILDDTDWNKNIRWHGEDRMTLIAVEPTNFGIAPPDADNGSANEKELQYWQEYQADPEAFVANIVKDWHRFIDAASTEANIIIMPTMPNTADQKFYDQVFTADASLSYRHQKDDIVRTFFSRFTNEERRPEVDLHRAFMETIDPILFEKGMISKIPERQFINMPFAFEGTGDCRWDHFRQTYFAGYIDNPNRANAASGRSDIRSHEIVKRFSDANVISLPTKAPYFHCDTAILPASETPHIFLYEKGFDNLNLKDFNKAAFGKTYDPKEFLIELSDFEADNFAANSVYIGNGTIIIPEEAGKDFAAKVRSTGLTALSVPMKYSVMAGGAGHCMTNDIYQPVSLG